MPESASIQKEKFLNLLRNFATGQTKHTILFHNLLNQLENTLKHPDSFFNLRTNTSNKESIDAFISNVVEIIVDDLLQRPFCYFQDTLGELELMELMASDPPDPLLIYGFLPKINFCRLALMKSVATFSIQ